MGVTICADCGGKVSDVVPACPHCGRPSQLPDAMTAERAKPTEGSAVTPPRSGRAGYVARGALVALLFGAILWFARGNPPSKLPPGAQSPLPPETVPPATSPLPSSEPSFDCANARSNPEHLICDDPELSRLDSEFGQLYKKAKAVAPDQAAFMRETRSEWKERESKCSDKECLLGWYAKRRGQLSATIASARSVDDSGARPAQTMQAKTVESPINLSDARQLDKKYGIEASVHCGSAADDYLRSIARYDFKWDAVGFFGMRFDKFLTEVSSAGVLTSTSDKALLQNGFGAYERVELFCDYDTQSQKVIRVRSASAE
jgi:uncharacterized protein